MRAGNLRHRLILQNPSTAYTSDGMGGYSYNYDDDQEVWGAIWPLRGQEKLIADQLNSEIDCQIRIRYTSGVTPKTRIQLGDTTTFFEVKSVSNPDYRNRELIIYCRTEQ